MTENFKKIIGDLEEEIKELKDEHGNEDWFVTPINLPEQEAHENYIGKRFNIGIDTDHMMKCWKVETLRVEK